MQFTHPPFTTHFSQYRESDITTQLQFTHPPFTKHFSQYKESSITTQLQFTHPPFTTHFSQYKESGITTQLQFTHPPFTTHFSQYRESDITTQLQFTHPPFTTHFSISWKILKWSFPLATCSKSHLRAAVHGCIKNLLVLQIWKWQIYQQPQQKDNSPESIWLCSHPTLFVLCYINTTLKWI